MNLDINVLGRSFLREQKGWDRGGGWVHPKGANGMAASRLSCRKSLVGNEWPISYLCTNGLRKRSSGNVGPLFRKVKLLCRSIGVIIGREP